MGLKVWHTVSPRIVSFNHNIHSSEPEAQQAIGLKVFACSESSHQIKHIIHYNKKCSLMFMLAE